jgi:hypothetical protein
LKVSTRLGFYYTKRDKMWLVHNAVKTVQREHPAIHSPLLLGEMRSFITIGLDEWAAAPGMKDDAINAYMLALLGAVDERPHEIQPLPSIEKPHIERPWCVHDIEADLDEHSPSKVGSYIERVLSIQ